MTRSRRKGCRGGSALEMAFFLPWYIFLFVGVYDWGFYAHALISTASAARVAALYTSTDSTTKADQATACTFALQELSPAPNLGSITSCGALPAIVTAVAKTGVNSADGSDASEVTVTYRTNQLIPIPGLLKGRHTFYSVVQMRVRGS
jgi:Flp pilus assembly protein TadG